ncbi:hypothetical protein [Curtobacterium sp. 18060]|uniref:tautomerase family protein n=1 Tax=Curtobacterium sp. 18060 TaxID=2681408 RepID=UPI001F4073AA|nr:hypothetical protein [Curtobacterium sp. 18060]
MPLIHISAPADVFHDRARDQLADDLTTLALTHEGLPLTPFVRSTTWIYFHEPASTHVYHGGSPGGTSVITVEISAFQGGLDRVKKRAIIRDTTDIVSHAAGFPADVPAPVYVIFRDTDTVLTPKQNGPLCAELGRTPSGVVELSCSRSG